MSVTSIITCYGCGKNNVVSAYPNAYGRICVECARKLNSYREETVKRCKDYIAAEVRQV